MKYWVIKNMHDEMVGIIDEIPESKILTDSRDVHVIWFKRTFFAEYEYAIFTRKSSSEWELEFKAIEITKAEYETYREFGLERGI